jgi:hypothetical protein
MMTTWRRFEGWTRRESLPLLSYLFAAGQA